MDDRFKLIEKLGKLSVKACMLGRMYHIDEVTELTKDLNELVAKVFDYSPWHTGTPAEEGWYLVTSGGNNSASYDIGKWDGESFCFMEYLDSADVVAWQKIEQYKEKEK